MLRIGNGDLAENRLLNIDWEKKISAMDEKFFYLIKNIDEMHKTTKATCVALRCAPERS